MAGGLSWPVVGSIVVLCIALWMSPESNPPLNQIFASFCYQRTIKERSKEDTKTTNSQSAIDRSSTEDASHIPRVSLTHSLSLASYRVVKIQIYCHKGLGNYSALETSSAQTHLVSLCGQGKRRRRAKDYLRCTITYYLWDGTGTVLIDVAGE